MARQQGDERRPSSKNIWRGSSTLNVSLWGVSWQGSGLAIGVDTIAHTAALEAGGRTLAVLASASTRSTPSTTALADAITARGALISEFLEKFRPRLAPGA